MLLRLVKSLALLSTGLLAGTFAYGATNLTAAFNGVPLDVRLTFHAELMKTNGPVVQSTMALAALSSIALAVLVHGKPRLLAAGAGALVAVSFLVTRFGNVPINGQIKQWAAGTAPADHAEILQRWEAFNVARTLAGLIAFLAIISVVVIFTQVRRAVPEMSAA